MVDRLSSYKVEDLDRVSIFPVDTESDLGIASRCLELVTIARVRRLSSRSNLAASSQDDPGRGKLAPNKHFQPEEDSQCPT
jgi:hypothetical protein